MTKAIRIDKTYTLSELIEAAQTTKPKGDWINSNSSTKANDDNWQDCDTYDDAVTLLGSGWQEGLKSLDTAYMAIPESTREIRPKTITRIGIAGSRPMIPLYVAGAPAHMETFTRELTAAPVIRLVVPVVYSWMVKKTTVTAYGAAIAALVDSLESTGVSVEVIGVWATKCRAGYKIRAGRDTVKFTITLKDAGQPLDMDSLSFALTNSSFVRRLMFRLMESYSETYNSFAYGYGLPVQPKAILPNDLVLDMLTDTDNGTSVESFYERIKASYEAFNEGCEA